MHGGGERKWDKIDVKLYFGPSKSSHISCTCILTVKLDTNIDWRSSHLSCTCILTTILDRNIEKGLTVMHIHEFEDQGEEKKIKMKS